MKHFLTIVLALTLAGENGFSQNDSLFGAQVPLTISIGTETVNPLKLIDTINITLVTSGYPVAGADLKIAFDSYAMDILEILRGEIVDSCQWEFFDVKASIDQGKANFPRSIWTILALSDFMPDSLRPDCFGLNRPASIARIVVSVDSAQVRTMSDTTFPIYFFWEDCSDNTVTNVSGDSLMMSLIVDGVYCATGVNSNYPGLTPPGLTPAHAIDFPSRFGTPEHCINPRAKNKPVRKLMFQSGGIRYQTVVDKK